MTDAISSNKKAYSSQLSSSAAKATEGQTRSGSNPQSSSGPSSNTAASSTLSLSNANVLQDIKQQIDSLPEVNNGKIDSVKQAIGNGEYQIDASVIAQKFIEIEKLLP